MFDCIGLITICKWLCDEFIVLSSSATLFAMFVLVLKYQLCDGQVSTLSTWEKHGINSSWLRGSSWQLRTLKI